MLFAAFSLMAADPESKPAESVPKSYGLGPGDQVNIRALHAEELNDHPTRLDEEGYLSLPLIGRVKAAGLTLSELEKELSRRLDVYIREPLVSVTVTEQRSQPFSVLGYVGTPGLFQIQGKRTLVEALSMAGGLKPEAKNVVRITRKLEYGAIPLPQAAVDSTNHYSVAEIDLRQLMSGQRPEENIEVRPYDVVTVAKADVAYVVGDVRRPGSIVLNDQNSVSILEALSLAEGQLRTASTKARIMRRMPDGSVREQLPIQLDKILAGKSPDVRLQANDVLFVPSNVAKAVSLRAVEAALQIGGGVLIYRGR